MPTKEKAGDLLLLLQLLRLELLRRLLRRRARPRSSNTVVTRKLRVLVIKEGPRLVSKACPYPTRKAVKVLNFEHKGTVEGTIIQDKEVDYPIKDKVDIKALGGTACTEPRATPASATSANR
ncbi:hypothetical protein PF001_g32809 [Phytophthora fragariae]|uniref:Uncharacterized protein n=1 Tax=Phytophthora fragariae TaxID=53985 RepID=A0A6A4AL18_9STRA|nr:hypothetical protein PF001_g32809 [Phytophthora fragariae]